MRHSYAATRAREALPPPLPAVPSYSADTPCRGLAFILRQGAELPDLVDLRDHVAGLRRGVIGEGPNRRDLLLVLFDGAPRPYGRQYPYAFPLVDSGGGVLASHGSAGNWPAKGHTGSVRALDVWWSGEAQRIALDRLEPLPVSLLWTLPNVTVHKGLRAAALSEDAAPGPDTAFTQDEGRAGQASVLRNSGLALLADEHREPPFAGMQQSLRRRSSLSARLRMAWAGLPGFGKLVVWAIRVLFVLMVLSTALRGGSILPYVIGVLIGGVLVLLVSLLTRGGASSGAAPASAPARARGPGVFGDFLGWLAWKNPFGSMQRQLQARVRQFDALANRGMIDEALRLAIRLGSKGGSRKLPRRFPRQLPSARARLDFEQAEADFEMPVLPEQTSWEMRQTYERLAQRLEEQGDLVRAAFIRSQLLGQHEKAVRLLEKGGRLDEAIRLAVSAKIDPALTIRLLYDAGKPDAALALARRSGCFEKLAAQSRGKDAAFHELVVKTWTDALLESGQPLRALQVTDSLASEANADPLLLERRRDWLGQAMRIAEATGSPAEVLARAILCGRFQDVRQLNDFPRLLPNSGDPHLDDALALLRQFLLERDDGEELLALLVCLNRLSARKSKEQAGFWNDAGPVLVELLANGLFRQASHRLVQQDLDTLVHLLQRAGHSVLAYDLGKLRKICRANPRLKRDVHVRQPVVTASPVLAACALGTGAMLAWRQSEMLELMEAGGAVVWRRALSDVSALVPVGSGQNALVLQRENAGMTRISRLDSVRKTLHPVGVVELLAHHDVTTELAWLVQIGGEIGALDLASLCRPEPQLEFLWSCSLTERVRVAAFQHQGTSAAWITIDVTPERHGVTEQWQYDAGGSLSASICRTFGAYKRTEPVPPVLWAWGEYKGNCYYQSLNLKDASMSYTLWSERLEQDVREEISQRDAQSGFDGFVSCDFGRSVVVHADTEALREGPTRTTIKSLNDKVQDFHIHHDPALGLAVMARLPFPPTVNSASGKRERQVPAGKVLLADQFGRMFLVDPQSTRVIEF